MNRSVLSAAILGVAAAMAIAEPPCDGLWQLAWADSFDGTAVDGTKWYQELGGGIPDAQTDLPGIAESDRHHAGGLHELGEGLGF